MAELVADPWHASICDPLLALVVEIAPTQDSSDKHTIGRFGLIHSGLALKIIEIVDVVRGRWSRPSDLPNKKEQTTWYP